MRRASKRSSMRSRGRKSRPRRGRNTASGSSPPIASSGAWSSGASTPSTGARRKGARRRSVRGRCDYRCGNALWPQHGQLSRARCADDAGFRLSAARRVFPRSARAVSVDVPREGSRRRQQNGSYAGAMGYGQFMPSSYRNYAIDFDGDGHIDILTNPDRCHRQCRQLSERPRLVAAAPIAVRAAAKEPLAAGVIIGQTLNRVPRWSITAARVCCRCPKKPCRPFPTIRRRR